MKRKKIQPIILGVLFLIFVSCSKSNEGFEVLGGSASPIGAVGNTFSISSISGLPGLSVQITDRTDGISTVTYTTSVTNSGYSTMINTLDDVTDIGTTVQREREYRITSNGIESIYPEGNLILVKYDAKVGDTYSLNRGSTTMTRKVTEKSTDDDYYWNGMMIKTITVKETGRNIPGISYIEYSFNHKFGIVGLLVVFEDGTSKEVGIVSGNEN